MSNYQQNRLNIFRPQDTKTAVDILTGHSNRAVVVMCDLLETANRLSDGWDPSDNLLCTMDETGLYDDKIVILYNDVCSGDIALTHAVIRASQAMILSPEQLHEAIDMRCPTPDIKKVFESITKYPRTQDELDIQYPQCPYNGKYPAFKL